MRKRNEAKPIQGWGWLGDAAEEAAVQAMAPARRPKNASTGMTAIKTKSKSAAGGARVPAKNDFAQLSDDEYRRLAKQQHESEGKIEIDLHARISLSEDGGAWVQGWVFVHAAGSE